VMEKIKRGGGEFFSFKMGYGCTGLQRDDKSEGREERGRQSKEEIMEKRGEL
jgi:hypothetical protein